MATRRRSSATTATRPVKKSPSKVTVTEKVTKYTKPVEIKKVTEETPVKSAPKQPNLSMKDYMDDFKVRWEIHQFETQELWSDMKKGYAFAQPFVVKSIDYIKDSYDRAFNQEETKQTT